MIKDQLPPPRMAQPFTESSPRRHNGFPNGHIGWANRIALATVETVVQVFFYTGVEGQHAILDGFDQRQPAAW